MTTPVAGWDRDVSPGAFDEIAELWNHNASGRHSFHPWTGETLHDLWVRRWRFRPEHLLTVRVGGSLAGFAHVGVVGEPGYPPGGAVEALLVDGRFRGRGVGTALLKAALDILSPFPEGVVDALGAWPYGPLYSTLADGSERSGVFLSEKPLLALFGKFGFAAARSSLVMRAVPSAAGTQDGHSFLVRKRRGASWLDRVFRGRELWDHNMLDGRGGIVSRAVFGRMAGESECTGTETYSLFGVHTLPDQRGKGLASANLRRLMSRLARGGAERLELHVYSDNLPALALYRGLGFERVAETVMMRLGSRPGLSQNA